VIAVDLQAHGRTADIDRPLRLELMGDDVATLARHLGHSKVDLMGYSLGGHVALRAAAQHHDLIRRLVLVSTTFRRDNWFPEVLAGMEQMGAAAAPFMEPSPIYQAYRRVAPNKDGFPALLDKMGDLLRQPYDYSADVAALPMPVLLAYADNDSISTAAIAEYYALLGGGIRDASWDGSQRSRNRLTILPGYTHYDVFDAPELVAAAVKFFDAV
jgi:pimeloyl-ACP methyl ester carboxylesterase